jgi:hypothetical protein
VVRERKRETAMGNLRAAGMAHAVHEGMLSLEAALHDHFRAGCYPPLPLTLVEPSMEAIGLAKAGEWEATVTLTDMTHRVYGTEVPVRVMIEELHLGAFVEGEEE